MAKEAVTVSIVNWNGTKYLKRCLDSLYSQDYGGEIEIIAVDNLSTDGSLEYLERFHNGIKIIKNLDNKGFAFAHNQAIRQGRGEYNLPLNFDILLQPDFISRMVEAMKSDSKIGIVSGKLYKLINGNRSQILDSTGILMEHHFMRARGDMEYDSGQYDSDGGRIVFGACGAAPFYRRSMLEDIKCGNEYFDENFVNYVEDVDISWRAHLKGWRSIYSPSCIAYHERGATRKDDARKSEDYFVTGMRNRYWMMIKNMQQGYFRQHSLKIIAREILFLLGPNKAVPKRLRLKAFFAALSNFRTMAAKRRVIQSDLQVPHGYFEPFFHYREFDFFDFILKRFRERCGSLKHKIMKILTQGRKR